MAQLKDIIKTEDPKNVRIAIARDVIARLNDENNKTITPFRKHWLRTKYPVITHKSEVKEVLEKSVCEVCALGAIFYSAVVNYNELKFSEIWGNIERSPNEDRTHTLHGMLYVGIQYYLRDVFSEQQLMLIELVFEKGYGAFTPYNLNLSEEQINKVMSFGHELTIKDCMIKIMQNIIDNDGEFKI